MTTAPRVLATAPAVALAIGLGACGSAAPPVPTYVSTPVASYSPTPLFGPGGASVGAGSPSPSGSGSTQPVLTISQYGLRMSFSTKLGNLTYSIDNSQNRSGQDQSGTPYTVNGTISLATASYSAMACAASDPAEATITVFTTTASSLSLSGPTSWTRAGSYLLGFSPGQSSCTASVQSTEIPLLQQMVSTATAT